MMVLGCLVVFDSTEVGKVGAIKRVRGLIEAAEQLALVDQIVEVPVEIAKRLVRIGVFVVGSGDRRSSCEP
jgi:hypothetical protein